MASTTRYTIAVLGCLGLIACAKGNLNEEGRDLGLTTDALSSEKVATDTKFRLYAEIASPVSGGRTLQANDLHRDGSRIYVAYNYAGEVQAGAIQVIDTSNPAKPVLVSEVVLADTDINGVYVYGTQLFAVGATSANGGSAILVRFDLDSGKIKAETKTSRVLGSYAGTDVIVTDSTIYALSGNTGGVETFSRSTLAPMNSTSVADARALSFSKTESELFVLSGNASGSLIKLSPNGATLATYATGGGTTPESKATIESGKTSVLTSLGESGFKILCQGSGTVLGSIPAVTLNGLLASQTVTNAVTANSKYVFTSNGEAGVYVYEIKKGGVANGSCRQAALTKLGALNFGSRISTNFVLSDSKTLVVAAGLGGVKVINLSYFDQDDDFGDFD